MHFCHDFLYYYVFVRIHLYCSKWFIQRILMTIKIVKILKHNEYFCLTALLRIFFLLMEKIYELQSTIMCFIAHVFAFYFVLNLRKKKIYLAPVKICFFMCTYYKYDYSFSRILMTKQFL